MRVGQKEIEWIVPLLTLMLTACGLIAVYSASNAGSINYFSRQLVYVGIGIGLGVGLAFIQDRYSFAFSYIAFTISLMLLGLVLMVGSGPTGRWLEIGSFHIQPSELAKLATILALARFLSDRKNDLSKLKNIAYFAFLAALPFGLILIEPDMGTSLVIPVIAGMLAIWAGIPLLFVIFVVSPIAVMIASINPYILVSVIGLIILIAYFTGVRMPLAMVWGVGLAGIGYLTPKFWNQLKPYQQQRLITFLNPEEDPLGSGYQLIQSKVAIGSGEFWGKGFLQGSQTQRGFLPEQHTDFIFSVVGEEFGFIGAAIVLLLFWLLLVRLLYLSKKVSNPFSSLIIIGVMTSITFQVIVNIGMTVGVMPVTGLPLPLLSYGGSSLLTSLMMLGLVTGLASRWRQRG